MNNDEAKSLYHTAVKAFEANDFSAALDQFTRLDAARPNSRHVMQYRAKCLIKEGHFDEAREIFSKLEGKLEAEKVAELRDMLAEARHAVHAGTSGSNAFGTADNDFSDPDSARAVHPQGANVFTVEQVFPASTDETTVTGHVEVGAFRTGDQVSVIAPSGMPVLAAVLRLGKAETPVKVIRAGQQSVMLLAIEPQYISPGTAITASSQEEAYAETMVVGAAPASAAPTAERTTALVEVERLVKRREYSEAKQRLERYLDGEPDSGAAHRLLAQVYLEGDSAVNDQAKALDHIRQAYELGGAEDPVVVYTLAQALAGNGEAEHGLRFLERLFGNTDDMGARAALSNRITDYREKFGLGHVWEFSDSYGEVLYEARSIEEVVKALKSNSIPKDGLCRMDHVGDWRKIEDTLAPQYSEVASFYQQKKSLSKSSPVLTIVIGVLAIAVVAAILFVVLSQ